MKKKKIDNSFIRTPVMKGGIKTMRKIITDNLVYPQDALSNKVEGIVKLKYDVDYKGNVRNVTVSQGIGHGCDDEAIRLVELFDFTVEKSRKKKVIFHKTIKIQFKLPVVKKVAKKIPKQAAKATSYQYSIIPSSKEKPQKSNSTSYSYTLKINK